MTIATVGFSSKENSLVALSLLCFFLADVRDGFGPFLGVYLQRLGWMPDEIGLVMTIGGLAGLFFTPPMGAFIDSTKFKRIALGFSIFLILVSCGSIFVFDGHVGVIVSKTLSCVAATLIAPTINAITLGMVGQIGFAERLGRNEAWNHAGNAFTAILGGFFGYIYGMMAVFWLMVVMGLLALVSLLRINPSHIDYAIARGLFENKKTHKTRQAQSIALLLSNKALLVIGCTLFAFHLGNAAMLPLLGQSAVAHFGINETSYTAITIVLAQVVMIFTALWASKIITNQGYGKVFLFALIVLPIRGLVAGLWVDWLNVIPVQILDGIGAGLIGVATPGIVARVLHGTGHVNLGLAVVLTLQEIGASLSNAYGGFFAHHFGYSSAFYALGVVPCLGLFLLFISSLFIGELKAAIFLRS